MAILLTPDMAQNWKARSIDMIGGNKRPDMTTLGLPLTGHGPTPVWVGTLRGLQKPWRAYAPCGSSGSARDLPRTLTSKIFPGATGQPQAGAVRKEPPLTLLMCPVTWTMTPKTSPDMHDAGKGSL